MPIQEYAIFERVWFLHEYKIPEFECHDMNLNNNSYLELLHYSFSFYCNSTTENRLGNCLPTCLTLTTLSSPHYMIYAEQTNSTTKQNYISQVL